MNAHKVSTWFLTENGIKFSGIVAGAVTTAAFCGSFLPHTLLVNKYQEIVHLYKNGMSVPLPEKLQKRFQKALDLVEVKPADKALYKPFSVYGFDIFSAGSSYSRFGVIIGIPANFAYEKLEDVDKANIKVNHKSVVWSSEEGEKLSNALILSENAQLYAIAREIKYRQSPKVLLDIFFATATCLFTYGFSSHINKRFNLYLKPQAVRIVMYGLVGLIGLGNYVMSKDLTQILYEEKIDKELKEINSIFGEGGKEFYTKILQRNIALRKLMGKDGESLYSVLGNENYFLRSKHLPLVHRKAFFEDQPLAS